MNRTTSRTTLDLIIIGATRSGTNMLRDVLCRLSGFGTWPCDEINYIWRHGNARWPSDCFPEEFATGPVKAYIRNAFSRRRHIEGCDILVEKTCANSLRVPFVARVVPDARYLFIHRDPLDAVASAMIRWNAPVEFGYTLAKARFVPLSDLPYYAVRFLGNRLYRLLSGRGRLAFWGPRLDGMDDILHKHSLAEICAIQWRECVMQSVRGLADFPRERVHVVAYEDFVSTPVTALAAICEFLGRRPELHEMRAAVAQVSDRRVGKGRQELSEGDRNVVEVLSAPALEELERFSERNSANPNAIKVDLPK